MLETHEATQLLYYDAGALESDEARPVCFRHNGTNHGCTIVEVSRKRVTLRTRLRVNTDRGDRMRLRGSPSLG